MKYSAWAAVPARTAYLIWAFMVTWRGDAGECRSTVFATISMNGGHNQTYTEFRRCVDEFWRISVKYLKSEVRSWDSDVRRKIGQKYHSCGAKVTCAASKVTCAAQISSVRQHFYHWNSEKYNMYMRIINVQTGTHIMGARLHIYYPHVHITFWKISMIKFFPHTWY